MSSRQLSAKVVGAAYENKDKSDRRFEIALCAPGEPVELRLEPKNKFDPHAVAVFSQRGVQLGYLPAERAPWIGGMIKDGREVVAIFQEPVPWGAVVRIGIDEPPVLPPARPKPTASDPDFYADPDYGDDFDQTI